MSFKDIKTGFYSLGGKKDKKGAPTPKAKTTSAKKEPVKPTKESKEKKEEEGGETSSEDIIPVAKEAILGETCFFNISPLAYQNPLRMKRQTFQIIPR